MRGGGDASNKSEFAKLAAEFKLSQKKINMIRIKAFSEMGQLPALKEFVLAMNKRSEVIPYEIIFEYLDGNRRQAVALIDLVFNGYRESSSKLRCTARVLHESQRRQGVDRELRQVQAA